MRLRAVQQAEVFAADADHLYDDAVVSDGAARVTFLFLADAITLLEEGISIVDVEGYRSKPVFQSEFGRGVDSVESAAAQDAVNVQFNFDFQNAYKIFDLKADITALLDNTDVQDIKRGIGRTFDYVEAVDDGGDTVGIDEFIVGSPPIAVPKISLRNATLGLLNTAIDPASYVGKFPIKSPQAVGAAEKPAIEIRRDPDFTRGRQYDTFRRATTKITSSTSRYRRVSAVSRYVPVKVTATIPLEDAEANDSLYLVIRANLPNGKLLSRFVFRAPSLNEYLATPSSRSVGSYLRFVKTIARSVQIINSSQAPQALRGVVRTYRNEPKNDTYYIPITHDLWRRRIPGNRIERRIGTNPFFGGFAFSSRMYRNNSNDVEQALRNASKQDSDDVKFQISRRINDLIIKVKKVAPAVTETILLRRNITRNEGSFSHLSTDASKCRSTSRAPLFIDDTCEEGHDYEYALGLIDKFGSLEVSEQKVRYSYLRRQEGISLRVTDVQSRLQRTGGNSVRTISFTIVPNQRRQKNATQFAILQSNNIPTDSVDDAVKSTTSYEPIFFFDITRENIDTGEIERCGTFTSTSFVDDSASPDSTLPLTPLKAFSNYRYTIKLGLEPASALIPTQYALAISKDGKKYPLHSYKFTKIDRLNNATPSEQELQGATRTLFGLIDTGIETSVSVTGRKQTVSLVNADVTRNSRGFNTIRWNVAGNVEIIDHFRIYASADGVECLLGCALPNGGENVFFDSEMFDRVGLVTYRVAAVLLDFSETASVTDTIFTLRSEPDFIVERSE